MEPQAGEPSAEQGQAGELWNRCSHTHRIARDVGYRDSVGELYTSETAGLKNVAFLKLILFARPLRSF
jgi:hypothetical protein